MTLKEALIKLSEDVAKGKVKLKQHGKFAILQDDIKRLRAGYLQDLLNRGFTKQFAYVVAMQTTARFMRSMWRVF